MKICYLIDSHTISSENIAEHFLNKGHDISLITFHDVYKSTDPKINLKVFNKSKIQKLVPYTDHMLNVLPILKYINKLKPDVIHGMYISNIASYVIPIKNPVILSAWGSDLLVDIKARHHYILVQKALKKAKFVTSVSQQLTQVLLGMGVAEDKILTVPIGLNLSEFESLVPDDEFYMDFPFDTDRHKICISTRNLNPIYDVQTLVKAIPLIIKKIPEFRFIIAGSGSQAEQLKDMISSLKIEDHVYMPGWIYKEKLYKLYKISQYYVSTSLSDGVSSSLLEAMAAKIIPIVSDIEGNRELIRNKKNGLMFPVGDHNKLAEAVIYAYNHTNFQKKATAENYRYVYEKGDLEKNMEQYETLYRKVTGKDD